MKTHTRVQDALKTRSFMARLDTKLYGKRVRHLACRFGGEDGPAAGAGRHDPRLPGGHDEAGRRRLQGEGRGEEGAHAR